MGNIVLIRHGQASFGKANYDQLSELGQQQAQLLGECLRDAYPAVDVTVCGTMQRHAQTAEGCLTGMQLPTEWTTDAGFTEYDHEEVIVRYRPEYEDKAVMLTDLSQSDNPRRAFQQLFAAAVQRWVNGEFDNEYTETWNTFCQRVTDALHRLHDRLENGQTAFVFTSGGVITAVAQQLLHTPNSHVFEINWTLVNAALTKLLYSDGKITLSTLNDYSHFTQLQQANQQKLVTYR